jgi:hypothetical protein
MRYRRAEFSLVSLASAISAASVFAQPVPDQSLAVLDPSQFSTAYAPDEMNLLEKLGWAGRVITGHPDTKAIVPTYSYDENNICGNLTNYDPLSNAWLLTPNGIAAGSLEELCNDSGERTWSNVDWATTIWQDRNGENLLLLPHQLADGKISEFWLRCRESRPPAEGSACHETFRLSPYDFHQQLAAEADS